MQDFGFVTIALGESYVEMAKNLARSLHHTNPKQPRAVFTDIENSELEKFYQHVIPVTWPRSWVSKLNLFLNQPFKRCVFIDADCLVYSNLIPLLSGAETTSFRAMGRIVDKSYTGLTKEFVQAAYPEVKDFYKFHSGVMYFDDSEQTRVLYRAAEETRALLEKAPISELADEDMISIALSRLGGFQLWPIGHSVISFAYFWKSKAKLDIKQRLALVYPEEGPMMTHIVHFGHGLSKMYFAESKVLAKLYRTLLDERLVSSK